MVKKESTILMLLEIIEDNIELLNQNVRILNSNQYLNDPIIQAASIRWLEVIGDGLKEILNRLEREHFVLTDTAKETFKEVYKFRNKLSHGYDEIDLEIVFEVIKNEISELTLLLEEFKELNDV